MTDYRNNMTGRLDITKSCWFEKWSWTAETEVVLHYIEHSPDPWYSDSETDIDIDRATAIEIVEFLTRAFNIDRREINADD